MNNPTHVVGEALAIARYHLAEHLTSLASQLESGQIAEVHSALVVLAALVAGDLTGSGGGYSMGTRPQAMRQDKCEWLFRQREAVADDSVLALFVEVSNELAENRGAQLLERTAGNASVAQETANIIAILRCIRIELAQRALHLPAVVAALEAAGELPKFQRIAMQQPPALFSDVEQDQGPTM